MNTMKNLEKKYKGKIGFIKADSMEVKVAIEDVKYSFGHERLLVKPIAGSGSKWINRNNLKITDSLTKSLSTGGMKR